MLESSYGLNFFLKTPKIKSQQVRYIYLRVTVDGIPKETSTKRKWDMRRWDQDSCRAMGTKEDARSLNYFLDELALKIGQFKTERMTYGHSITADAIINFVNGKTISKRKVLEEFLEHNNEMQALVPKEYAKGTYKRYVTALSHVADFISFKYNREDIEFRELNYEFVKDYEFYLKTVRKCANNTTLKYISNLKKIVLRAIAKEIIVKDPFTSFKAKKVIVKKKPLTRAELELLENKKFDSDRLTTIRDVFVFQCYTGLAYIDVFQLKKVDIKKGIDGRLWIMSNRQKTKSTTDIPLLPKAIEIMEKYKDHPLCVLKGTVLPVRSNQKMNEYLKEIADLINIQTALNTHKARRTFASTVTLNNGVPIHVVKEMLGHKSVKQTEEYAITEQESINKEMLGLRTRLAQQENNSKQNAVETLLEKLGSEMHYLRTHQSSFGQDEYGKMLADFDKRLDVIRMLSKGNTTVVKV